MKLSKEINEFLISKESPLTTTGKIILFVPALCVLLIFWIVDLLIKPEKRWQ